MMEWYCGLYLSLCVYLSVSVSLSLSVKSHQFFPLQSQDEDGAVKQESFCIKMSPAVQREAWYS